MSTANILQEYTVSPLLLSPHCRVDLLNLFFLSVSDFVSFEWHIASFLTLVLQPLLTTSLPFLLYYCYFYILHINVIGWHFILHNIFRIPPCYLKWQDFIFYHQIELHAYIAWFSSSKYVILKNIFIQYILITHTCKNTEL